VNRLSPQTISRVPAVCLPLLGGQNGGEGDNMRVRLRFVGLSHCLELRQAQKSLRLFVDYVNRG
jgi:hypothetical protein